ncbi:MULTISPECIES: hypothetical protein [Nocardiopsis]|uniref:PH domain-containing protein n=1 Tax=Nocardiopsis lambiniae TaxID=3075539 RepID=A0ABU2M2U9_9ACTN|nr:MULTISPECIES: hypothetical protein [unclassified Nocardiopsis]MDE3724900.1 hypothetical protein [Nocardiopsis sp. N85]MDT0326893.1 hypothetical protein [Nocardiopsis sp. DSM 44743]
MSQTVRLVCPSGRKHAELWSGYLLAALGAVAIVMDPAHWANITLGLLLVLLGVGLAVHGHLIKAPVLEISDGEFHYRRGAYEVSVPFGDIGSYYLLPGGVRSLGLCDTAGRPKRFPSLRSRRTSRTYLPLTGMTSPAKVESFMAMAGIPPRKRSLAS